MSSFITSAQTRGVDGLPHFSLEIAIHKYIYASFSQGIILILYSEVYMTFVKGLNLNFVQTSVFHPNFINLHLHLIFSNAEEAEERKTYIRG